MSVIPGIQDYLSDFMSEKVAGPEGYLADKGLIALPDEDCGKIPASVKAITPMAAPK